MSRMRMVSPGIWTNERMVSVPPLARLLFIGLWGEADREGRLPDRPLTLKMRLLPADDCDVNALLVELHSVGLVGRYSVAGDRYLCIPGFAKHQRPHPKEPPSTIPPPTEPLPNASKSLRAVAKHGEPGKNTAKPSESESESESLTTSVEQARPEVQALFEHWRTAVGRPKAQLDDKRRRLIRARLEDYGPDALRTCITGYAADDWHRGQNDRGKPFLDLELMLRDAAHVEKGLALATAPSPSRPTSLEDQPARML